MIFLNGLVQFTSDLDLPAVAAVISGHLFGGVPFVPTRQFDEEPGVCLERDVLMTNCSICGERPDYALRIRTSLPAYPPEEFPQLEFINITSYLEVALSSVKEIRITPQ